MRSASRFLGAFALLAFGWIDAAQATILCKTKDGTLKARDTANCPKHETRVDPAALGLQGPPGPQGPPGLQGIQGLPGPLAALHTEVRTSTFPILYNQPAQTLKASCLPGEVIIGAFGTDSVGLRKTTSTGSHYDFAGNVWSFLEDWPTVPLPNTYPAPSLEPVDIDLICLSVQPAS